LKAQQASMGHTVADKVKIQVVENINKKNRQIINGDICPPFTCYLFYSTCKLREKRKFSSYFKHQGFGVPFKPSPTTPLLDFKVFKEYSQVEEIIFSLSLYLFWQSTNTLTLIDVGVGPTFFKVKSAWLKKKNLSSMQKCLERSASLIIYPYKAILSSFRPVSCNKAKPWKGMSQLKGPTGHPSVKNFIGPFRPTPLSLLTQMSSSNMVNLRKGGHSSESLERSYIIIGLVYYNIPPWQNVEAKTKAG